MRVRWIGRLRGLILGGLGSRSRSDRYMPVHLCLLAALKISVSLSSVDMLLDLGGSTLRVSIDELKGKWAMGFECRLTIIQRVGLVIPCLSDLSTPARSSGSMVDRINILHED
jgi:hypothetical protein